MSLCQCLSVRLRRRGFLCTLLIVCLVVALKNTSHNSLIDKIFPDYSENPWNAEEENNNNNKEEEEEEDPVPIDGSNALLGFDASSRSFSIRDATEISASFVPGQPKFLVILAYQRTGSTFLGRLFNRNPDVFYLFEPLDALYSSLYGTHTGWNVPSDITNDIHGAPRSLPEYEIRHVSTFLRSILTCNISALPTETLFHPYIIDIFPKEFSIGSDYVPCVKTHRRQLRLCRVLAPIRFCGKRFMQRPERLNVCYVLMTNASMRSKHKERMQFDRYLNCTRTLRKSLESKCIPHIQTACDQAPVRAVKLVRATMRSMVPLLEEVPNVRVLHLVRDPRGVAVSRTNFHSSGRGLYSEADKNETTVREAFLFCQTVVRDLRLGSLLSKRFPGKVLTLVYDDLVRNLSDYTDAIYKFLDLEIPEVISKMIQTATVNHTKSANHWQSVLTYKTSKDIRTSCEEFFSAVRYDWSF